MKSGPRLKWIFPKFIGSIGTVLRPSPKSPVANLGLKSFIEFKIHWLKFGSFREQIFIVDAEITKKKNIQIKNVYF